MKRRIQLECVRPKPSTRPTSNSETRYRVLFEGKEIGVWEDPECSAARYLIDNNLAARGDVLQTYRGDKACLNGSISWFADHRVIEDDGPGKSGTPRFVKWHPNPFAAMRALRAGQASDDPEV